MKYIWGVILILCSFSSCELPLFGSTNYYKSFYLGENSVIIDGTIFQRNSNNTIPENFDTIHVRSPQVSDWRIDGVKNGTKYEFTINNTGNGVTISNGTINNSHVYISGLDDKRGTIARIDFYIDDGHPGYPMYPTYRELNNRYYYVYVTEPLIFIETVIIDGDFKGFASRDTYHYDYYFDRPGWYKIILSDKPITDESKYSSGKNTNMTANRRYVP
ncbi:MAG: hypothetical protein FWD47_12910 [Treponema sp.]|nr:hypothetical protein [Treponema sp.]